MNEKRLITLRLHMEVVRQEDIKYVFQGLSDPEVNKYYGVSYNSIEEAQEQMNWYNDLIVAQRGIWWSIREKETDKFVGAGGFNDWHNDNSRAEVGFWLLPEYWGQGYMQEAMKAILEFGFNVMNLNRVEGFVESNNVSCKRAIEKVGFYLEGTMKEVERKSGVYIDLDIYRMLEREWQKNKR